jgi:ribosomal protein S18 acetylase RimI-like enzyme
MRWSELSNGNVVVRKPLETEVDTLAELVARLKALNEELDPNYKTVGDLLDAARDYVAESLKSDDTILLVAEDTDIGKVVGIIRVEIRNRRFYEPRVKGVITDLYVHPSYRRKKVGALLIDKVIEELRSKGIDMLTAIYPVNNIIAREFYGSLGFTSLDVEVYKII